MKENENIIPRAKLTDALPPEAAASPEAIEPGRSSIEPEHASLKQHNAEVNAGIKSNKDMLVDIGRGEQAAGRQKGSNPGV